tara:strand:- start:117 stop:698 length:582 start_codon:yes stop_codon:yes gene_type:complete
MEQAYIDTVTKGGRAIPGQSLTNNPEERLEFEKSPEITNLRDGLEFIFVSVTEEDKYPILMDLIQNGVPVMEVVQTVLFQGFNKGKWNPDLMLLLAEPAAYMIMALAERAGIDYIIYQEEDEEDEAERSVLGADMAKEKIQKMREARKSSTIPEGAIPVEIAKKIEAMPEPSLMAEPAVKAEEEPTDSLLGGQ